MSRFYQRPENAISKAEEFINVGKPTRALETLYEVIKSKKRNNTLSEKLFEEIMFKYLELCVDLKKSQFAKEGLFQYRNMCQSTNVASLASVVQGYLNMAEKRTDAAKQESQESIQDVDDLENLATPEMIMLSVVSAEDAQDRSDRTILMPWVKFLWESYCQCLELLRTNVRVERLYHDIAQQAFRFCLKYQRKTEFRKLCDKLRNHLDLILKQAPSPMTINLNNSDTQQMNLDTRLVQLDAAIQMELWQEAYKAVEDIHGLNTMSKKVFQPKMMANYYQKLALVFWKSGNYLFHAATVFKHFQLTREMKKNISQEELAKMASRVVFACLAVPLPSQHPEFDKFIETDRTPQEKMARLAVLLNLQQPPTRMSLLKDANRFGVVQASIPEIQNLYNVLEVDFGPLKLCQRVQASLKTIEESGDFNNLQQYITPLKEITLVRLLKQVSQVYQSICFSRLLQLAPFTTAFQLERIIVDAVRHNDMQIRIDHRNRTVYFGTDLAEAQTHETHEGPHLQDMPSEQIRTQLMSMLEVLDKALKTIHPEDIKVENNTLRQKIVEAYHHSKQRDHQRILMRQKIIEDHKEDIEKRNMYRENEEMQRQVHQLRQQQKLEEERLKAEREKRERDRQQEEIARIQKKHMKDKVQQIAQTEIGKKILDKMDEQEIAQLDADQIMAKQVEELEREKRELVARLKAQEKRVDHLERAKRQEEIPLLKEAFEVDKEEDKVLWKKKEEDRIAQEIKDRELAVENKKRLGRMKADKDEYIENKRKQRKTAFENKLKEFNRKVEEERAIRLEERKEQRKEERRAKWIKEREEEEQRRRDEEAKRQREEAARIAEEKKKEEEEMYRKRAEELEAIEEKKRQREREIEEKLAREREEFRGPPRGERGGERERDGGRWRNPDAGGGGGGSWRDMAPREDRPREDRPPREDKQRDERGPPRREGGSAWKPGGGSWRDREKAKEEEWGRRDEDREERRDDRGPREERGPPPRREEGGGAWRRGGDDRGPPPRGGDRFERRDDRFDRDRRDDRRDFRRDDDRRDFRKDDRAPPGRDEGGSWRRGGPPPARRDDDRRPPPRDDDRRPLRDDDRPPRDEGAWRSRDAPPKDGGGAWRRDGPPRERDGPPRERDGPPRERDGPRDPPKRDAPRREGGDDDGWTTVSTRR